MEIKEYIKKGDTDDIKDIFKIRLHMRDVKKNQPKNDLAIYMQYAQFVEKKTIQQRMPWIVKQKLRKENTQLEVVTNHWKQILKIFKDNIRIKGQETANINSTKKKR